MSSRAWTGRVNEEDEEEGGRQGGRMRTRRKEEENEIDAVFFPCQPCHETLACCELRCSSVVLDFDKLLFLVVGGNAVGGAISALRVLTCLS